MTLLYSLVIPFKDEEGNVIALLQEVEAVMQQLAAPWELIAVDDGSTDQTLHHLNSWALEHPYLKLLIFDRNYGQSSAFDAGFKKALGRYVITLDGDRQNDPKDIPKMLEAMGHADLICGYRKTRLDKASKRWISRLANWVRRRVCQDGVQDTGCSLKIYRRESLNRIKMYHGMHRFLPALFRIEGFTVKEIEVHHRARTEGYTKYRFSNRSLNTVADMLAVWWMRKRQLRYQERE